MYIKFTKRQQIHRLVIKFTVDCEYQCTLLIRTEVSFLSKGHSTQGPKIPFISNLKKPTCHNGGLITKGGSGIILWTYSNINSVTL